MRSHTLLVLGALGLGCSEPHAAQRRPVTTDEHDAGETSETEDHAEPAPPHEPELGEILDNFFAGLRALTKASCVCAVEGGDYPSEEGCVGPFSKTPSWRDCAVRGLEALDKTMVRHQLGCQANAFFMQAECLNALSCVDDEARLACQSAKPDCESIDQEIVVALSRSCSGEPVSYEDAD